MCSLLAIEPSVEEKLQKLHSEIKFALKVDNPVRPSSELWEATSPEPSNPRTPSLSRVPLEVSGNRQILGPSRWAGWGSLFPSCVPRLGHPELQCLLPTRWRCGLAPRLLQLLGFSHPPWGSPSLSRPRRQSPRVSFFNLLGLLGAAPSYSFPPFL